MRTYTQLTQGQRYQIYTLCTLRYVLLKAGHIQTEIAYHMKVHKSTISRELRRNRGLKGYRPKQAHQFALNRRKKARYRIEAFTWILIEALIRQEWSPEQVSDWLKENYGLQISHEWIYQYILMDKHAGGDLPSSPTMPDEDPDKGRSAGSAMEAMTGVEGSKTE